MKFSVAILLIAAAAPSPEIRYFRYQRPIDLPANASGQACLVLDALTFAHAAPGLEDVRLYRSGDETPYVIHCARPNRSPQPTIAPINQGVRNGRTVFDVVMPEGEYSDVQLNLRGRDFLATVTVTGSHSAGGAGTRIGSYTIFDFSSQHLGRSTVLHLPRSNFRTLHFELAGRITPEKVFGITAAPAPGDQPRYQNILSVVQLAHRGRTSIAEFSLPANVPIDRIGFTPPPQPANFSREVEVQALETSPSKEEGTAPVTPVTVAIGNLLRIHREREGRRIDEENLAVEVPGTAFALPTRWSVTIQNGDDLPISFEALKVQMLERDLCFETAAGANYVLYYGDKVLPAPRYDYAAWFSRQSDAGVATLGGEQAVPTFQERPDSRPFTEKHPALLWIALVLVVLLLGLVALHSGRHVEERAKMP